MDPSRLKTTRRIANLKAGRNDWYRIVRNQAPGTPTSVMVYDEIGFWGVTAQDFINDLKDVTGPIDLHLNSPGGEVFDGLAIYQYLSGRGDVTTHVDSLAASIASVIAMAGTEIVMGRNAAVMIHDGFGLCIGNAADMREEADLLDRVSDNIASVYADRTGKPADHWRALMLDETWFIGQEAVDAGLADRLAPLGSAAKAAQPDRDDEPAGRMAAHFDLSVFRNTPERLKASGAPIRIEWAGDGSADDLIEALRRNLRVSNHAAPPPPTTSQPHNEAPADADRGFLLSAGDTVDGVQIPRDDFRAWLAQGMQLIGEPAAEPVHNADSDGSDGSHPPFTGTHSHAHHAYGEQGDDDSHEHEHSHDGDANHRHDHGEDGGEESDGDGGMQDRATGGRVLGIESMPLTNKALPVHHTATEDSAWDGPAAVAAMPNDASVLVYCHAWEDSAADDGTADDPDGDADDKKDSFRFPHHRKKGGPANVAACRNGLARLEGSKIPDSDKPGVKAHLQAHLDDANKSDDDGASNHTHEDLGDAWAWDREQFIQAMEGAH